VIIQCTHFWFSSKSLFFGYPYCIKVTFGNNYRYNAISAISIGLIVISEWILKSAVSVHKHKPAFRAFKQL